MVKREEEKKKKWLNPLFSSVRVMKKGERIKYKRWSTSTCISSTRNMAHPLQEAYVPGKQAVPRSLMDIDGSNVLSWRLKERVLLLQPLTSCSIVWLFSVRNIAGLRWLPLIFSPPRLSFSSLPRCLLCKLHMQGPETHYVSAARKPDHLFPLALVYWG